MRFSEKTMSPPTSRNDATISASIRRIIILFSPAIELPGYRDGHLKKLISDRHIRLEENQRRGA